MLYTGDSPQSGGNEEVEREEDCLRRERQDERLVAFDAAVAEITGQVLPAYSAADGWLERTRAGLLALLGALDERPVTARALVVDSIAWGPAVLGRRGELLEVLAETLEEGRDEWVAHDERERTHGELERSAQLPRTTGENLVGASLSWVHKRLAEESGPLMELAPSLTSMIVHPYLGDEAARAELERSAADFGVEFAARESGGQESGGNEGGGRESVRPAYTKAPVSRVRATPS